jgi:translocation and assembly module TamB
MPDRDDDLHDAPPPGAPEEGDVRADEDDAAAGDASGGSPARAVARVAVGVLVLVFGLLVLAILTLQTRPGAEWAVKQIVRLSNPYEDATITVDEVRGNWLSNLRLYGLRLTRKDGTPMAVIDTLEARYNLLALPGNRLHVREGLIAGAYLNFRQGPDRVFDVSVPFLPDTLQIAADSLERGLKLQLENITVRRGNADFEFYTAGRDSILRLRDFDLAMPRLVLTDTVGLTIDSLRSAYVLPRNAGRGLVRTGLTLNNRLLDVDGFRLTSTRSDVTAQGRLRLPEDSTDTFSDINFRFQARPLAFADLAPYLPMLNPEAVVTRADVRATGSGRFLRLNIDGATADSGTVRGQFALTPIARDSVRYFAEGSVRGLDPLYFTRGEGRGQNPAGGRGANRVSLDLTADLRGRSLETVSGPVSANVLQARLGDYVIERATLAGTFDAGQLDLSATADLRGAELRLAGRVRGLDLAAFDAGQPSDLSGTLRMAGVGTSLDSARTDLRLDLDPSRLGRYRVVDGLITARLVEGDLRFGGQITTPEGLIAATGDARNLGGRTPAYRITDGRLENFDVAAFTGQSVPSRVNATFTIQGAGFDPERMNLRLEGTVGNSTYGEYAIERADVSLIADGGFDPATMRLDADGTLGGFMFDRHRVEGASFTASLRAGRLALDAQARTSFGGLDMALAGRPFAGSETLEITRGRFTNLNVGALTGNPDQSSDLTGSVSGTVSGFDPATMTARLRVTLDPSVYNAQEIQRARADLRLAGGTLTFDVDASVPGGRTLLAGSARPFDAVVTYRVDEGYVSNLNLQALLNDPALSTNLNGSIRLQGRGTDLKTLSLTADLDVGRSRYADVSVDSGRVRLRLDAGLADATLRLFGGGGRLDLTAAGRFFDDVPTYRLRGTAAGIDVGRLVGQDTLGLYSGDLAFRVEGTGKDPRTMRLDAELYGDSLRYRTLMVDTVGTRFRLAGGVVTVDTLGLRSNVADAQAGGYVAVWDTLTAASDFRLETTLRSLTPLRPFLGARQIAAERGALSARLYGRPGDLRYEAGGRLFTLVYNDLQAANIKVSSSGQFTPGFDGLKSADFNVDSLGYLSLGSFTMRQSRIQARLDSNTVTFNALLDADDRRAANVTGRMDIRPEARRIDLEAFNLRFDRDQWRLAAPATITYGERYRISNFLLTSGDQQVVIDGVVDPSPGGQQNLVMTLDGFRVGALADLFGYRGLDGRLTGTLDLTGPAAEPNLTGTLSMSVLSYADSVGTVDLALRYDSLRLNTDALFRHRDGSTLAVNGYIPLDLSLAAPGDTLGGDGGGGVAVRTAQAGANESVNLRVVADSFSIGWIRPFLDRNTVRRLEGKLHGDLVVTGQLGNPLLAGDARLVRGLVDLPAIGVVYRDLEADFVLAGNNVNVRQLTMRSGPGRLTGTGRLELAELTLGQFDLDLVLDDFQVSANEFDLRRVSGPVRVRGTTDRPRVEGEVQVLEADLLLTQTSNFEDVPLTREDVLNVETRFGIRVGADTTANQLFQNTALDLRVQLERDVWLRSTTTPQLDIQFTGSLEVRKASGDPDPQIYGDIEVIPQRSNIAALGRRFNLTTGVAQFNGALTELFLDVVAEYTPRRPGSRENIATITLTARGRPLVPGDLSLVFNSDPPMDTADILSYIATGRPADQALALSGSGAGGGLLDTGAGLALGQLASFVEGVAGRDLGLDVIEIEQEGTSGTRLTAGKYLSPRLYASVSTPINYGGGENSGLRQFGGQNVSISLEYELRSWLLAVLGFQQPKVSASLRYDYSY